MWDEPLLTADLLDSSSDRNLLLFFITLKPRVERYTKSKSLTYEPASEPLHI